MIRREFLKYTGALAAQGFVASTFLQSVFVPNAQGQNVSIQTLKQAISSSEAMVLVAQDAKFKEYQRAFNMRTLQTPMVRVLCSTPDAVAKAIQWAQVNNVPLAIRSGGHSFEGLSQGTGLVIDTRPMQDIVVSQDRSRVTVGAGVQLISIYNKLAPLGLTIPAGSGPTVGIAGHTLGGGYGMLARYAGLACDSLTSASVVNAEGQVLSCSADENADLFWALRGGGAGSFGIVTKMTFKTWQVSRVMTFAMTWNLQPKAATALMKRWQDWAHTSPKEITSLMKVSRKDGLIRIRLLGQAVGSEKALRRELSTVTGTPAANLDIRTRSFMDAVAYFSGGFEPEYLHMKGKSDYLRRTMSPEGLAAFVAKLPVGLDVIFDSYGGAINDLSESDTAFAHRGSTISSVQYYTQWADPAKGRVQMANLKHFHDEMRPHFSGGAYFNYCDLDLADYASAYWGANLPQLQDLKRRHDPKDFFRHAQSIPLV